MPATATSLETLCINQIRGLAMDAVQAANSGHPGAPMGDAPMAYTLWTKHLRFNPKNPHWFNRDRFILSNGHASMLLYSLLFLTGFDLPLDELKRFRQWGSKTPGHPENHLTPGVEMATGPLGQGIAHSVGFAMAEAFLAATFNKPGHEIIDHYTFGICSDGDLMEGVSNEAASLAGHQKLGKLIFLYDDNHITIDGRTDRTFTEDTAARYKALGWHVQEIDGMNTEEVHRALIAAKEVKDQPSLIKCRTIIGFGSPNRADTSKAHGEALGEEEVKLSKQNLGIPLEPLFYVNDDALAEFRKAIPRGEQLEADWNAKFEAYERDYPNEAKTLKRLLNKDWGDWQNALPDISEKLASRASSGKVIAAVTPKCPTLMGGSADLAASNNTDQKDSPVFQPDSRTGKNLAFGIREHSMVAAVNGITLHGGCRAYGATFLVFSDYCKPSLRLAAIMECPSIVIFTHDSIGLGEDGPTHQPIEHLMALRAIPNFNVLRPCDGNETVACWRVALESTKTPCALILTRQGLEPISPAPGGKPDHPALKGAYILREASSGAKVVLVATGSEVKLALDAAAQLEAEGTPTRVVSMPSWFLFEQQSEEYRNSVLPKSVPTVSIEAGTTLGWDRYAQAHVGIDHFGASAPGPVVMEKFGFTIQNVVDTTKRLLQGN